MKKPNFRRVVIAITIFVAPILLASCQKTIKNETCEINMVRLSGAYVLTGLKYKISPTAPEQDFLLLMDFCEKDDVIHLYGNGVYDYTDAGIRCDPEGSGKGTWSLTGKTLTSDGIFNGEIEKFDCKTLIFSATGLNIPGDKLTITLLKG